MMKRPVHGCSTLTRAAYSERAAACEYYFQKFQRIKNWHNLHETEQWRRRRTYSCLRKDGVGYDGESEDEKR